MTVSGLRKSPLLADETDELAGGAVADSPLLLKFAAP